MRIRRKAVLAVAVLVSLACLTAGLSGCHKDEEATDSNYNNGKDFKGHGGTAPAVGTAPAGGKAPAGGTTPATGQGRKGGD
jgi:hypothetical protein